MSKAADEYEEIARRLKEIEADRQLALTGSTLPESKVGEYAATYQINYEDFCG
jgi:hypothetical protein